MSKGYNSVALQGNVTPKFQSRKKLTNGDHPLFAFHLQIEEEKKTIVKYMYIDLIRLILNNCDEYQLQS